MPSLRRSFSSPSVRSSPYPSSLSSSAVRARATPIHPRRSSGSATAERRVLADIEWWRVYDGQCDPDQVHEEGQASDRDVPPGGTVTLSAGGGSLEPPQTPLFLHGLSLDSIQSDPLAAFSMAPHSPSGSRHSRGSSVMSTPELSTAPLESVQLGLASPASSSFGDHIPYPLSLPRAGNRQIHPLFGLRAVSDPGLLRQLEGAFEADFADIGGDSFLDQNIFQ